MAQNFTYLMFLCAVSMLLIVGGVLLTNLPIMLQIIMILIGLVRRNSLLYYAYSFTH